MDVAAIMPCRGRADQTVTNVRRLLQAAGDVSWRLWCVVSNIHDPGLASALDETTQHQARIAWLPEFSYWHALAYVCRQIDVDAPLLCNLANDLVPGRNWLARGVAAYQARFSDGDGLMGFNDGLHGPEHSSHFLISRALLERYGGWPVWYQHNFGDTELCARAQRDGCYGKAAWAILFHNHVENGANDDEVYQAGRATYERDARLFEERRRQGWPAVPIQAAHTRPIAATSAVASAGSNSD